MEAQMDKVNQYYSAGSGASGQGVLSCVIRDQPVYEIEPWQSGHLQLTPAEGFEKRKLEAPAFIGQQLLIFLEGKDWVIIRSDIPLDQDDHHVLILGKPGDWVHLVAIGIEGAKAWRVMAGELGLE